MNAVVKNIQSDKPDVVTLKAAHLGAMAKWASATYGTLEPQDNAEIEDGWMAVQVYALAIDRSAMLSLEGTYYRGRSTERDEPASQPAIDIKVSEDDEVFRWYFFMQDWGRKRNSRDGKIVVGIFEGPKLLFDFTVSPRPKGVSPKGIVNALKLKLASVGMPEGDLQYC